MKTEPVKSRYLLRKTLLMTVLVLCFYGNQSLIAQAPVTISQTVESYNGKDYYLHVVESQQTLYGIAKAYGITVESLMMANPDSRRGIRVKQVLRVPVGGTFKPEVVSNQQNNASSDSEEYEYIYHVTGKNETFAYIADVYMINERDIRIANPSSKEPFDEGAYVLLPISKKDKRPTVVETQYKRNDFDPYAKQAERQKASLTPLPDPKTTIQKPVETISSFEIPNESPVMPPKQTVTKPDIYQKPLETQSQVVAQDFDKTKHVVKPKETLYGIARQYNITPSELLEANPGMGESLKQGQVLKIPESKSKPQTVEKVEDSSFYHTVEKGETLYKISRQYAVSITELKQINAGLTETLKVGQRILIPKKKITKPYLVHTVDKQIKSKQLARDFDISMDELNNLNPSIGKDVFPNQNVLIPISSNVHIQPLMPGLPQESLSDYPQDMEVEELIPASNNCIENEQNALTVYRVALMLPLYLEDLNNLKENAAKISADAAKPRIITFLPFYKGFLMAADSLATHFGLKLELMVYDVDQSANKTSKALNDPKLQSADLIIGPFFSQQFEMVATFAKQHKILIVNPMSQRRQILKDNPYVIKIKPDIEEQYEQIAASIADRYPKAKVFIFHSNSFRNTDEVRKLKTAIENHIPPVVYISNNTLYDQSVKRKGASIYVSPSVVLEGKRFETEYLYRNITDSSTFQNRISVLSYDRDSLKTLKQDISEIRENIVIAYTEDRVFAMEFVNKLNRLADSTGLTLFGLPHWYRFDNLFNESLLNLNANYLEPGFINYNNIETQFFIDQYRKEYTSEPENYAFEGFDIGWYFLNSLMRYGKNAGDCLPDYRARQLQTTFCFSRDEAGNGLENKYWNIYSFRNYSLSPVKNAYFFKK